MRWQNASFIYDGMIHKLLVGQGDSVIIRKNDRELRSVFIVNTTIDVFCMQQLLMSAIRRGDMPDEQCRV